MMRVLKVNSVNSWGKFDGLYTTGFNRRFSFLKKYYTFEVSDRPDYIFSFCYSDKDFKREYKKLRKKIHIRSDIPIIFNSWENFAYPNLNLYDYAISTHYIEDKKHLRLPGFLYFMYWQGFTVEDLVKTKDFASSTIGKERKFCSFLHSHNVFERNLFVELFSKLYKKVDCGGMCLNNIGGPLPGGNSFVGNDDRGIDKLKWLSEYKFNMALQQEACSGYTDENIMDAMLCKSIPIFYGNPNIDWDFNPKSFIHVKDYKNRYETYKQIRKIDQDDVMYKDMLEEPWYHDNQIPENIKEKTWLPFFRKIFD